MRNFLTHKVRLDVSQILAQTAQVLAYVTMSFLKFLFSLSQYHDITFAVSAHPRVKKQVLASCNSPLFKRDKNPASWPTEAVGQWASKSCHFMFRKPIADPRLDTNGLGNCSLLREDKRHTFCQRILNEMMAPWSCSGGLNSSFLGILMDSGKTELSILRCCFAQQWSMRYMQSPVCSAQIPCSLGQEEKRITHRAERKKAI